MYICTHIHIYKYKCMHIYVYIYTYQHTIFELDDESKGVGLF